MTKVKENTGQTQYMDFILGILNDSFFEAGSVLREKLVAEFGVTEDNARQIILRAARTKQIKSSKPYTFGKGQFLYLLPDQDITVDKVKKICKHTRPPLYRLLQYMEDRGGIVSVYEAMKITASPDEDSSTKVSTLKDLCKILSKLNLVYEKNDSNGVTYLLFTDRWNPRSEPVEKIMIAAHYGKMLLDTALMTDIIRWLAKTNLIDNVGAVYRNKKLPSFGAKHNSLLWDGYSYTKTTGINTTAARQATTSEKKTLVVLDVVVSEPYSQLDLDGFLARVQININSVKEKSRKVLPIVIYKTSSDEILNKIRSLGFLAFDIGSIFGQKIYDVLNKMQDLHSFEQGGQNIEASVAQVLKTIRAAGQDDALNDLKGVLFEVLMYPVLKDMFPNAAIERGKYFSETGLPEREEKKEKVQKKKEGYEYDYIFNSSQPKEIIVIELKGYNSAVSISLGDYDKKASLKWFFERTLPFAKRFFKKEISEGKRFKGMFITTGNFYQDGHDYLKKLNEGALKSVSGNIAYDRTTLLELLRQKGFDQEVKIIETYYVKQDNQNEQS